MVYLSVEFEGIGSHIFSAVHSYERVYLSRERAMPDSVPAHADLAGRCTSSARLHITVADYELAMALFAGGVAPGLGDYVAI